MHINLFSMDMYFPRNRMAYYYESNSSYRDIYSMLNCLRVDSNFKVIVYNLSSDIDYIYFCCFYRQYYFHLFLNFHYYYLFNVKPKISFQESTNSCLSCLRLSPRIQHCGYQYILMMFDLRIFSLNMVHDSFHSYLLNKDTDLIIFKKKVVVLNNSFTRIADAVDNIFHGDFSKNYNLFHFVKR